MGIAVVTGGRERTPTLAELERARSMLEGLSIMTVRHGGCRGTDVTVAAWLEARTGLSVEAWPALEHGEWPAAGPRRNRAMITGDGQRDLFRSTGRPPADVCIAFHGGDGTADCIRAAREHGVRVECIEAEAEPRPWNRHHGEPPGRAVYVGRGSPLGNPFPVELLDGESRADAASRILGQYRRWLWSRLAPGDSRDPGVVDALATIGGADYLVCSCWPAHCHAETVVAAWRWQRRSSRNGIPVTEP